MIVNPNKYIRSAYVSALKLATRLPVWYKKVPITVKPIPSKYIILDSQTKNETTNGKIDCFEWLTTIDVNIYNIVTLGTSDASVVDDLEQIVINTCRISMRLDGGFSNKNTKILESLDLSLDTSTTSVDRKLIKFQIWVDRVEL